MGDNDGTSTTGDHTAPDPGASFDPDAGLDLGLLSEAIESTPSGGLAQSGRPAGYGLRRRLTGFLALVLGVVGMLASLVVAFLILRTGFSATSTVDNLLSPVAETIGRVETRIDQADDVVNRNGVASELMPELLARSEGLSDVAGSGRELFTTVTDHPVYGLLPAQLDPLTDALDEFAASAVRVDEVVTSAAEGRDLKAADAELVADELDGLQAKVAGAGDALDDATRSLKRWIRFGAFIGLLVSLWSFWAQFVLARRGLRAVRGRPV